MRECKICKNLWSKEHYNKNRDQILTRQAQHDKRFPEIKKEWRKRNRAWLTAKTRERRRASISTFLQSRKNEYMNLRDRIIAAYGACCKCCGERNVKFLQIDHVNNDGYLQRKEVGGGVRFYRWVISNGFPDSLQLLCANCNWGKRTNNGICPHVTEGSSTISTESTSEAIADGSAGHPWPVVYSLNKGEDIVTSLVKARAASLTDAEWI